LFVCSACDGKSTQLEPKVAPASRTSPVPTPAGPPKLDKLSREEFNRLAPELALPLFWTEDKNKDGVLDPDELAVYWGLERGAGLQDYTVKASEAEPMKFNAKMLETYARIVKQKSDGAKSDDARRSAVKKELAQGRVTLVASDLSKADPEERRFVAGI